MAQFFATPVTESPVTDPLTFTKVQCDSVGVKILSTVAQLRQELANDQHVAFVPTMGALHEGHAVLIRHAAGWCASHPPRGACVVSIFVNPTQFNDPKDFDRYPKTLEEDVLLSQAAGATYIYAPSVEDVYPSGELTRPISLPGVAMQPSLEDAHRPGHFEGVYRVVRRLFEIVKPQAAFFGEKDWQQLQLIIAMVGQEKMPIEIVPVPTVREPSGLAMSSRNRFLSSADMSKALAISQALRAATQNHDINQAEQDMMTCLAQHGITPEYATIREAASLLKPQEGFRGPYRALIAAKVGNVRLIDNALWGPVEAT